MKKLPNFVKWIIILAALAAMGWMMWAVNDRASRVEMPAPDNTFGIYHPDGSSDVSIWNGRSIAGRNDAL